MALQQTRYTYPISGAQSVRLYFDTIQKYVLDGGISLSALNTRVDIWRYIGVKKGHQNMASYNPDSDTWDAEVPRYQYMRMRGWELVETRVNVEKDYGRKSLYIDIDTKTEAYSRPGYYCDMWTLRDVTTGQDIGPVDFFFRLESRVLAASGEPAGSWWDLKITPDGIPYRDSASNQPYPIAVGVIPIVKNLPDQSAYHAIKSMISSAFIGISEIWFYSDEITGGLNPPVKVFSGWIDIPDQVFNIFYGRINPDLFVNPGSYRVKLRLGFINPWESNWVDDNLNFQDFWKSFSVGRNRHSLGELDEFCFPGHGTIPVGRGLCSMVVSYDTEMTSLGIRGDADVSSFFEPQRSYENDKPNVTESRYYESRGSYPTMLSGYSGTTGFTLNIPEDTSIQTSMPPLFTNETNFIQPDLPFDANPGTIGYKYDISGIGIKTSFNMDPGSEKKVFAIIDAPTSWIGASPIGRVRSIVFNHTQVTETGSVYGFGANGYVSSGKFLMAFISDAISGTDGLGEVIPSYEFSVSPDFEITKSFIDGHITSDGNGDRKFSIQIYYSEDGTPEEMQASQAERIFCDIFRNTDANSIYNLSHKPRLDKFDMIAFLGNTPMIKDHHYTLSDGGMTINRILLPDASPPLPMYVYYGADA